MGLSAEVLRGTGSGEWSAGRVVGSTLRGRLCYDEVLGEGAMVGAWRHWGLAHGGLGRFLIWDGGELGGETFLSGVRLRGYDRGVRCALRLGTDCGGGTLRGGECRTEAY